MKASELMIGDFVFHEKYGNAIIETIDNDFGDNPSVKLISENIKHKDGYKYGYCWCDLDEIFPIPLTPEILEKNGFTHSFGDSDFYDYEKWEKKVDNKTIRVIKDHDGWFCRVDDNKLTRSMGIAPAVHTMQNIIRIGGIDWNLEL